MGDGNDAVVFLRCSLVRLGKRMGRIIVIGFFRLNIECDLSNVESISRFFTVLGASKWSFGVLSCEEK